MEERLTLTTKELKRVKVCELIEVGRMSVADAAGMLGISERQCWRVLARYRAEGAAGLVHGNRGRASERRLPEAVRTEILTLAQGVCRDYNDQHLTEVLQDEHDLVISRATVRRVRRGAGLASPHKYRRRRGHQRRERYPQAGMLLQFDASIHDWLEGRGPKLALVAAIDDATNEVVGALFRPQEDAAGYFLLLRSISQSHGLPLAAYADRHTIFQSPVKPTIEQELSGSVPKTQFARLVEALNIELIAAHSPQAKGRIERLWQTLQDRLVKELRQAGASDLAQANQVLVDYLPTFNQRFRVVPAEAAVAFRPVPAGLDLDTVFSFHYQRQVANDHTISLDNHKLQLPALAHGRSYARAKVDLHHYMDGRLAVFYQSELLTVFEPAEPGPPRVERFCPKPADTTPSFKPVQPVAPTDLPAEARSAPPTSARPAAKPAANHPWRHSPIGRGTNRPLTGQPEQPAPAHTDIFTDR
jgi:transposase